MVKNKDIPFIMYFVFMIVYLIIGNNEINLWNGMFFCFNYFIIFFLFKNHRSRIIRFIGMIFSISLFLFSILKFFTNFKVEKEYSFIPFFIILLLFFVLSKWER
jgi:hypothetical protein